jgi:hypothetical protein
MSLGIEPRVAVLYYCACCVGVVIPFSFIAYHPIFCKSVATFRVCLIRVAGEMDFQIKARVMMRITLLFQGSHYENTSGRS